MNLVAPWNELGGKVGSKDRFGEKRERERRLNFWSALAESFVGRWRCSVNNQVKLDNIIRLQEACSCSLSVSVSVSNLALALARASGHLWKHHQVALLLAASFDIAALSLWLMASNCGPKWGCSGTARVHFHTHHEGPRNVKPSAFSEKYCNLFGMREFNWNQWWVWRSPEMKTESCTESQSKRLCDLQVVATSKSTAHLWLWL